jgi:putative glutamine amidotransferase
MSNLSANCFSRPLKIAISRGDKFGSYSKYQDWINASKSGIELVNLYGLNKFETENQLKYCAALLLSGGNDIHPFHYHKNEKEYLCKEIDDKRDTQELMLISNAMELKMPILGICRGMQMLNVACGGSLITDIPSELPSEIKHHLEGELKEKCFHNINIFPETLLNSIGNSDNYFVNSYHHQSIDRCAELFKVAATSDDGIIEAIEWKNPENRPFLLGVQWHPERMNIFDDFSLSIAAAFIDAARDYNESIKNDLR